MFYRTQLKSVGVGGAVDMQGRRLTFIGYLPCKAGDWVYTDGSVIFGNSKPKGAPIIFDEQSSIPVLGDSDSSGEKELRGYFTTSGKFKKYAVAQGDWITNDKKNFGHGDAKIDGKKIIDAGYSDSGDLYVATDGQYRECHTTKYNNHLFRLYHSGRDWEINGEHWVFGRLEPYLGEEVTIGVEADSIDIPAVIYKNGEQPAEFNLKLFADLVEEKSFEAREQIMARSANMDADGNLLPEPPDGVNWTQQPLPPPDSFTAIKSARILTFKFDQQGDWDAIITASAYGYCFPFLYLDGSVLESSFDSATPEFDDKLPDCINSLEQYIFWDKAFPFLSLEKYPSFSGTQMSGGQYTAEYKKWCEDAIAYYIPLVRFTFFEWFPVAFGASMLFHVRNGKIITIMRAHLGIGHDVDFFGSWNEVKLTGVSSKFRSYSILEENYWQFPIGDGIFLGGKGDSFNSIFDGNGEKLSDLPNFSLGYFKPKYPFNTSYRYDAVAVELYKQFGAPSIAGVHNSKIYYVNDFYNYQKDLKKEFTVFKHPDEYFGLDALKPYRLLTEFYDEEAMTDDSRDGFYRFNPSCKKLCNGGFLFGIYGENLYLKPSSFDIWRKIGDGLKNFRLRELKKISKAKNKPLRRIFY